MAEVARRGRHLALRGFDTGEVGRLLEQVTGTEVRSELADRVHGRTGGNAFFVRELGRLLGGERESGAAVPSTVREVLERRVAKLDDREGRVLALAAVIGQSFALDVLEHVAGTPGVALDQALRARLVERLPDGGSHFRFVHALVRDALYDSLPAAARVEAHRRVGAALEALREAPPLAELAQHFAQGDVPEKALAYAGRAGEQAMAQLAYEDAARHFERAAGLATGADRLEPLLALADARNAAGEIDAAREACREAADLAERLGNADALARAARGFTTLPIAGLGGVWNPEATALIERALDALPEEDSTARAQMLVHLAMELYHAPEQDRAAAAAEVGVAMARRLDDPLTLIAVLRQSVWFVFGHTDYSCLERAGNELVGLARAHGQPEAELLGHVARADGLFRMGDLAGARGARAAVIRLAEEQRLGAHRWYAPAWAYHEALLDGRLADAREHARQTFAATRPTFGGSAEILYWRQSALRRWHEGRVERLIPAAERFPTPTSYPLLPILLAWIYVAAGRHDDARRVLAGLSKPAFPVLPMTYLYAFGLSMLAEVCWRLGDAERCGVLRELLRGQTWRMATNSYGTADIGPIDRARGLVAEVVGEHDEAISHHEAALAFSRAQRLRLWELYAKADLARALVARGGDGDAQRAGGLAAVALREAEPRGLAVLAQSARDVLASVGAPGDRGRAAGALVGRDGEVGELSALVNEAAGGHGGLALVTGEAGIGKTRLAEEAARLAAEHGLAVTWATCWEGDGAPPYWPWVQVVRALTKGGDVDTDLAPLLGKSAAAGDDVSAQTARFRLFDAVARLIGRCAGERPLLIVLDDLHWADPGSLRLLEFVAAQLPSMRAGIVGTSRIGEPGAPAGLVDLARRGRHLPLAALDGADVGRFLAQVTGRAPEPDVAERVRERTAGNPFLVRELGRLLAADARGWEEQVPVSVAEVVERRLERLGEPAVQALGAAAVLGQEFGLELLEPLTGTPRAELLAILDQALRARLVERAPGHRQRFRFVHALVRDALYDAQGSADRAAAHRRAGEALAALPEDQPLAEIAHHFSQAGDREQAIDYAERAGRRSLERLAHEDAAGHFERALGLVPDDDQAGRLQLLLAAGEAWLAAGESERGHQALRDAAHTAEHCGDSEALARAALGLTSLPIAPTAGLWWEPNIEMLERALAVLPGEDSAFRARLLARLAWELVYSPRRERAASSMAAAVAMVRRLGDPAALASVLRDSAMLQVDFDRQAQLEVASELIVAGRAARQPESRAWGHIARAEFRLRLGDRAGAEADRAAVRLLTSEDRLPSFRFFVAQWDTHDTFVAANLQDARDASRRALAVGQPVLGEAAVVQHFVHAMLRRAQQGLLDDLLQTTERYLAQAAVIPGHFSYLAWMYALADRTADARRLLERLSHPEFPAIERDYTWAHAAVLLAETCWTLGDGERAAALYEPLREHPDVLVVVAYGALNHGPRDRALGLLAETMGRADDAVAHHEEALAISRRLDMLLWELHAQADLARALAARGRAVDAERARGLAADALERAEPRGLVLVARRARSVLDTLDAVPPATRAAATPGSGARVRLRLLGGLELEVDGEPRDLPTLGRARSLLAYLALHPGPLARGELAARFWPDVLDESARTSLRTALAAIRKSLVAAGGALAATRETVALTGVWTDVDEFERLAANGAVEQALSLYRGPLLAGLDDDWVLERRDEFRDRVGQLLAGLAAQADSGRPAGSD